MERRFLKLFLSLALAHSTNAAAQTMSDLPNPFEDGSVAPSEQPKQSEIPELHVEPRKDIAKSAQDTRPSYNAGRAGNAGFSTPVVKNGRTSITIYPSGRAVKNQSPSIQRIKTRFEQSETITNISRATGGQWYTVDLSAPARVDYLMVRAASEFDFKIHEAYVILEDGRRFSLREFKNTARMGLFDAQLNSESLTDLSSIASIQLRLESFGGPSSMILKTSSPDDLTLHLRTAVVPAAALAAPQGNCVLNTAFEAAVRPAEREMLNWSQRKQRYYRDTAEYRYAEQKAVEASRTMLAAISAQNLYRGTQALDLLATEYSQKAQGYFANTLEFKTYDALATALYNAMPASVDVSIRCQPISRAELLSVAAGYRQKAQNYFTNTIQYRTYEAVAAKLR